jgi:hypothetical protein
LLCGIVLLSGDLSTWIEILKVTPTARAARTGGALSDVITGVPPPVVYALRLGFMAVPDAGSGRRRAMSVFFWTDFGDGATIVVLAIVMATEMSPAASGQAASSTMSSPNRGRR